MGASASFGRRHESQSDLNRPRACSARHLALAATAVAACFSSGPSWCTGSTSSARLPPKQRIALKAVKLRLDPPEIGQPQVPDLPTQQLERIATSPPEQLPPALQRTHMQALQKVLRGLRLNLHRLSAILPTGLGDGTLGSRAVKELFRTTKMRPFRAVVLMPKVTLLEAEARYKAVAGAGLLVMRLEASDAGTDKVVKALSTSQGLLLVGAYEDAIYFVRGFRRVKAQLVNLLICEMAHAALADSKAAHRVVLEWEKAFRVDVLQSLYISSQSLEPNPVKGFEEATMQVPGVPSYEVVARRGGPGGPEVFSVDLEEAQRQGITVPLKLVVLPATGQGMIEGLAGLHHSLGIEIVKAIPEAAGGGKAEAVEFLNEQVQSLTQGRCKVWSEEPIQQAVPDALLVTGSKLDPMFLLQAVERVAFKARGKTAGYIIILGGLGPAPTAAWRALSAHDPRLKVALQQAAVVRGRLGRALTWQDLPSVLQEAVVSTTSGEEKVSRSWLLKAVDDAIMKAADRWDLMYGHLLAYRESMEDPLQPVPLKAEIHGVQVGMWVAQQFLEWRSGTLSAHRRELLAERGLDVEEEDARSFAEGLAEFEQHLKDSGGNSYVPPAYFTSSGFPLAAWATKQRASWRRGRLSVERQYMLDAVGFPPVAHPDDRATREVTRLVEAVLRNGQLFPQKRRNHIFTVLLRKYHPDSMARMTKERAEEAAEVTQFLAGYREWFLNPPPPPLKAEDVAKLTGFEDDERDSKA